MASTPMVEEIELRLENIETLCKGFGTDLLVMKIFLKVMIAVGGRKAFVPGYAESLIQNLSPMLQESEDDLAFLALRIEEFRDFLLAGE